MVYYLKNENFKRKILVVFYFSTSIDSSIL